MLDIESYISRLIRSLQHQFGSRLLYVGLQGSYLRLEATDSSDIDIMVIMDELGVADLDRYRAVLQSLEHFDKSCGFNCSKTDLANWNPLEISHLLNGTKDYYGTLRSLVPEFTREDIRNFVKLSLNNLYHEICHRYIHGEMDKNIARLPGTYKGVFYILQNLYFLRHGVYIGTKAELLLLLDGKDHAVLARSVELSKGMPYDFSESFEHLFTWCQETLQTL